jgi:hypothetical protein
VFVALVIRHALRVRRIVVDGWPVRLYNIFSHYLINGTIFKEKVFEYKMHVLTFSTALSETFLILRRSEADEINNVCWSSC